MKQFVSIAFALIYSLLLIRPAIPIAKYYLDLQAYRARCINIEKPVLQCEGTCHLQSEIKNESGQTEPAVPLTKPGAEDPPIILTFTKVLTLNNPTLSRPVFPSLLSSTSRGFGAAIFHPPSPVLVG